ncbi:ABC transporter permease [Telmatospirillum sp.]|uniref:ABC transporter permease n=1 Tax=Telmatospirillum sp. TaxID=2079197 RepID=UPI002846AB7C|nr:ABC transporter permease [Telmatospirillum sp.]MDR3437228.1 ABC transporter permease [Telmatospirillum sp.]
MGPWFDYTVNGLVVGNIYALLAVGLALIFGVANLINFAHGSVFTVGAYLGWTALHYLHTPLPVTILLVAAGSAVVGVAIERFALRPLNHRSRIAPLLATIGVSLVLDQAVQLIFSPDPRALPSQLPDWRLPIGGVTIGALDLLIAGVGLTSAALLFGFLRFSKLGWAVRATAQDPDAASQMGVDTNRINAVVFAIASALGGVGGLLVGMFYNSIDTTMSFDATLKGMVAMLLGGLGNVPGAIAGGLILGLAESYGIALFGTSYRNLFAFALLILILMVAPNGLFSRRRELPPEPMTGTFVAPSRPLRLPRPALAAIVVVAALFPLVWNQPYVLQTLTNALLMALLAFSLTLVSGTVGQISLGHAGLLAIGGYASGLLALDHGWPFVASVPAAGLSTAILGTLMVLPALRMTGHYVAIATLGVGEIVSLVILNWTGLTRGPMGLSGIPIPAIGPIELDTPRALYWVVLVLVVLLGLLQVRLLSSHLGRTWRAIREDEVAARAYGVEPLRYKAMAFAFGGFGAGIAGAIAAHLYSYINHETFNTQLSILAITVVILGGLGNVLGAVLGAVLLVALPEIFRAAAEYRMLIYGIALLLLIRYRPQGLLGTI